jgi:hypothetical protein
MRSDTTANANARGAIDIAGLLCADCVARGHSSCYAHCYVDGKPTCIFCEDGVPCAHDQEIDRHRPQALASITPPLKRVKPSKESPVQTAKSNGAADPHPLAARLCKCGCDEVVPAGSRFSYVLGHMKRRKSATAGKPRGPYKKKKRGRPPAKGAAPEDHGVLPPAGAIAIARESTPLPACERVAIQVSEAQLSDFLSKLPEFAGYAEHLAPLPIGLKQVLVNLYLASPAAVPE